MTLTLQEALDWDPEFRTKAENLMADKIEELQGIIADDDAALARLERENDDLRSMLRGIAHNITKRLGDA